MIEKEKAELLSLTPADYARWRQAFSFTYDPAYAPVRRWKMPILIKVSRNGQDISEQIRFRHDHGPLGAQTILHGDRKLGSTQFAEVTLLPSAVADGYEFEIVDTDDEE